MEYRRKYATLQDVGGFVYTIADLWWFKLTEFQHACYAAAEKTDALRLTALQRINLYAFYGTRKPDISPNGKGN